MSFTHLRAESLDSLRRRAHAYFERVRRPVATTELANVLFDRGGGASAVAPLLIRALLGRDERFRQQPQGRWQLAKHLYRSMPIERARFAVVDLEATGSHPSRDRIIEVAVIRIEGLNEVEQFDTLVDPQIAIPPLIRQLTGIDESMTAAAPRLAQVAPRLLQLLEDAVFVAHNSEFDYRFLRSRLRAAEFDPPAAPRLCTMRLAQRRLAGLGGCGLDSLARHFGVKLERRHRAVDDARATAQILLRLIADVRASGAETVGQLLDAQRQRV